MDGPGRIMNMRTFWRSSVVLTLGLCASGAWAEEGTWRPAAQSGQIIARAAADDGNRWYASAEYLLWWTKASPTPILVTTGDPRDGAFAGALGRSGTLPLFGDQDVGIDPHSGGRLNFGYWFTDDHCIGLDFSGF